MEYFNDFSRTSSSKDVYHLPPGPRMKELQSSLQVVSIPRKIMQTWKTSELPDAWKASQESIRKFQPEWEYTLLTDNDCIQFVKDYFPTYLDCYLKLKYGVQKADMIRYMWLFKNGGIYLDCDYMILKKLDSLFYSDAELYFINSPNIKSVVTNSFMASKPGCGFWLEVLEEVKRRTEKRELWARGKHLEIMMTTGPGTLQKVLKETRYPYMVLPVNLINPKSICEINTVPNDAYYLHPLQGSSWAGYDTMAMNWCFCHSDWLLWFGLFLIILAIVLVVWWSVSKRRGRRKDPPIVSQSWYSLPGTGIGVNPPIGSPYRMGVVGSPYQAQYNGYAIQNPYQSPYRTPQESYHGS